MRPVLFRIPLIFVSLPIFSYGVMLALSLIVGWYIVLGLCERDGMDREKMGKMYVWTAVCSVAGSRLLYVFTNLDRFDGIIDVLKVNQGGLVAYGGFLGGFFTVAYGVIRFFLETLRADDQRGEIGPLSTSQFIGLVTSALGVAGMLYLWRRYRRDPASMRYWELPLLDAEPEPAAAVPPPAK